MPYIAFIVYTLVLLKSSYCWEFVKDWQIAINIEVLLCSYFYVVLQVNLKALKMLKLFLNNLICEVEMSVIRH